jgi:6-phosphogluconolactonase/glucosamine-6-phosphate isomerase/deaminase
VAVKSVSKVQNPYSKLSHPVPETKYYLSRGEFDRAVGKDFIKYANRTLEKGLKFMVGLSHGKSPSGAYRYILEHYSELVHPENILYTFVNSPTFKQRKVEEVVDARRFIMKLFRAGLISRDQVIGHNFNRESIEAYAADFNKSVANFLSENEKEGLDYVFLACNPQGRVAAIDRNSKAFDSSDIAVVINTRREKELTGTPQFLLKSRRVAFLATKADKRRPLAWLYAVEPKADESPGFLRFLPALQKRMTVFVDDEALTWPEIEVIRETPYGPSTIRVDTANPYDENAKEKLPVVVMVHGFLGLNSFDGLLATIPSHQCTTDPYPMNCRHLSTHITWLKI